MEIVYVRVIDDERYGLVACNLSYRVNLYRVNASQQEIRVNTRFRRLEWIKDSYQTLLLAGRHWGRRQRKLSLIIPVLPFLTITLYLYHIYTTAMVCHDTFRRWDFMRGRNACVPTRYLTWSKSLFYMMKLAGYQHMQISIYIRYPQHLHVRLFVTVLHSRFVNGRMPAQTIASHAISHEPVLCASAWRP